MTSPFFLSRLVGATLTASLAFGALACTEASAPAAKDASSGADTPGQKPPPVAGDPQFTAKFAPIADEAKTMTLQDFLAKYTPADAPVRVGVVAFEREGSEAANRAYFADYAAAGRVLGRGQLFVYTLPTSVAAECAIACRLTGPLLYVAAPDGWNACAQQAARSLLADGLADAVVLLCVTPETVQASVVTVDSRNGRIDEQMRS